jgi:hypothetical protein
MWSQSVSETIAHIDFLYEITITLKNAPHEKRRKGAQDWLAGRRDDLTEDIVDLMLERVERTYDLDTRAALKELFPILTTERRWTIRSTEKYESEFAAEIQKKGGDLNGMSVFDLLE